MGEFDGDESAPAQTSSRSDLLGARRSEAIGGHDSDSSGDDDFEAQQQGLEEDMCEEHAAQESAGRAEVSCTSASLRACELVCMSPSSSHPQSSGVGDGCGRENGQEKYTTDVCRICFEGAEECGEELMSGLCSCAGSMACLHMSCLNRWIVESGATACEICKEPFNVSAEQRKEWLRLIDERAPDVAVHEAQTEDVSHDPYLGSESGGGGFFRSCMSDTWRRRSFLNSSVIVLIGSSILVMLCLLVYHFLSNSSGAVVAGPLPMDHHMHGRNDKYNCSQSANPRSGSTVGWLCGVPVERVLKGDCSGGDSEQEPCGTWDQFKMIPSDLPGCFFGHGSICYIALQPKPASGGFCVDGSCVTFNATNSDLFSPGAMQLANGVLTQGRCVACDMNP